MPFVIQQVGSNGHSQNTQPGTGPDRICTLNFIKQVLTQDGDSLLIKIAMQGNSNAVGQFQFTSFDLDGGTVDISSISTPPIASGEQAWWEFLITRVSSTVIRFMLNANNPFEGQGVGASLDITLVSAATASFTMNGTRIRIEPAAAFSTTQIVAWASTVV